MLFFVLFVLPLGYLIDRMRRNPRPEALVSIDQLLRRLVGRKLSGLLVCTLGRHDVPPCDSLLLQHRISEATVLT